MNNIQVFCFAVSQFTDSDVPSGLGAVDLLDWLYDGNLGRAYRHWDRETLGTEVGNLYLLMRAITPE